MNAQQNEKTMMKESAKMIIRAIIMRTIIIKIKLRIRYPQLTVVRI